MPDMGSIAAAIGSLKTAGEIAKSFLDLKEAAAVQGKVIELQGTILAAQQSAFSAQTAQTELLQKVGSLEKRIADLEAWGAEKERYELTDVGRGVLAYTLKPSMQGAEPPHQLCAHCYQQGSKAFLQPTTALRMGKRVYKCAGCKTEYEFNLKSDLAQPPGDKCPACGQMEFRTVKMQRVAGALGKVAGVQERFLECKSCGHKETKTETPK